MKKRAKNLIESYNNSKQKLEEAILLAGNRFIECDRTGDQTHPFPEEPTINFQDINNNDSNHVADYIEDFSIGETYLFATASWDFYNDNYQIQIPLEYFDLDYVEYAEIFTREKKKFEELCLKKAQQLEKQEKELLAKLLAKYGTPN